MGDGESTSDRSLNFEDMTVVSAVGRGAKGVVFLARAGGGRSSECVALKVMSKALIAQKRTRKNEEEYGRVSFEEEVLRRFDHPLLPRLRGVLETEKVVAFAIDYCHGGTLHSLRKKQTEKMFSDDTIRYVRIISFSSFHFLVFGYRERRPCENENLRVLNFTFQLG